MLTQISRVARFTSRRTFATKVFFDLAHSEPLFTTYMQTSTLPVGSIASTSKGTGLNGVIIEAVRSGINAKTLN